MAWIVHLIIGARPNLMKAAPLLKKLREDRDFSPVLVDTGQHYDHEMSGIFREQFGMGDPDISLSVGSGSHGAQTAKILQKYEAQLMANRPDAVIVIGDVNSTVACSLAAAKLHIPVVHLEAGLRSHDRRMPEELNRIVTDQLSDLLWTPSTDGDEHLISSGIPQEKIVRVGNIMIDSLVQMLSRIELLKECQKYNLNRNKYAVITLHRPSNVDDPEMFTKILSAFTSISKNITLIWPIHPRTKACIERMGLNSIYDHEGIQIIEPLGYLEFMSLIHDCRFVLTDSGGIQEETTYLGIPCLTLRPNTERPITITEGTNKLVEVDFLLPQIDKLFTEPDRKEVEIDMWDGNTAERCVESLKKLLR